MTDYAKVYDTSLPMAERRDALVPINTERGSLVDRLMAAVAETTTIDNVEVLRKAVEAEVRRTDQDYRRVVAHLPGAAAPGVTTPGMQMGSYRDPLDPVDVLDTLRGLAVHLFVRNREVERTEAELRQIKADVAAHRRVLGLAPGGSLDNYGRDAES